ncbi:MAG TPA: glycosyltransferase family 2 protein, partial [Chitinophaga sp.]|uniref:glycosyltransferase family 2 protein n=1 Tax=Chitinophaga sp. TaxID=1869181 RepID=UPI002F9437FF
MEKINTGISVIMPTYNQGSFIVRAISSLLAQEHEHWELIIINDGSTDYTEELLAEHRADKRIRYFKHTANKGLGYCLNLGMRQASYNYISYLPSDDIFYADHLSSLLTT